jgi:hypothetical protein
MTIPKPPELVVELAGGDGNPFAILGSVVRALRAASSSFTTAYNAGQIGQDIITIRTFERVE